MHLVTRMVAPVSARPVAEQIGLTAERRLFLKRRWRGKAEDGTEFGFDLESRLKHGAVIWQSADKDYVIWQQPEPVFEIPFSDAAQGTLMGWRIGNLHFAVQILEDRLRVTNDPAIRQLLEREGWPFEEKEVVFSPLRVITHAP